MSGIRVQPEVHVLSRAHALQGTHGRGGCACPVITEPSKPQQATKPATTACVAGQKANLGATVCTGCAGTADVTFSGTCAGGVSTTGTSSGTITDGPNAYGDNMNCNWLISSTSTISLTFSQIQTEFAYDFVYVYRCTSPTDCTQISKESGTPSLATTYTSNTGYMKIQLTSDNSAIDAGIVAAWTLAAALCKCYPGQYSSLGTAPCSDCAAGTYSGEEAETSASTCVTPLLHPSIVLPFADVYLY
jgi:hypothetical protein